jgi:hypothetical protein
MANSTESAATTSVPGQVLSGAEAIRSKESKSKEAKEAKEVIVVVGSALEGDIREIRRDYAKPDCVCVRMERSGVSDEISGWPGWPASRVMR